MKIKSKYSVLVDYIFWISFIVFTNPAGILKALGENSGDGGIDITDLLFVILFGCFIIVFNKNNFIQDKYYNKIVKYLFIFLLYYMIVFSFFVPLFKDNPYYSFTTYVKIRHGIMSVISVVMVYQFYLRSHSIFIKLFLYSSILIIALFILTVITGIKILPTVTMSRDFINTTRLLMDGYGLMPILIPMGIVLLIFKFDINYKNIIIIGFVLMFVAWVLSLLRRNIFGTFLYFLPTIFLFNFIQHKSLIPLKKIIGMVFYSAVLIFILQLSFPKYVEAAIVAGKETIHVVQYGKTTTGAKDPRLGMGKKFMRDIIKKNPFFGTGFDNRWRTLAGDTAGYEATDYPFIGALAMTGIIGLLFFLPIYLVLIKVLIIDIKYFRKHPFKRDSFETYMVILFIVYFIFEFLQYMNWFLPISIIDDKKWYVF